MFPVLKPFQQNLRQCRFGHDSNPLLAWHTCSFLSTWDASHTKFRTDSAEEDEVNWPGLILLALFGCALVAQARKVDGCPPVPGECCNDWCRRGF